LDGTFLLDKPQETTVSFLSLLTYSSCSSTTLRRIPQIEMQMGSTTSLLNFLDKAQSQIELPFKGWINFTSCAFFDGIVAHMLYFNVLG
jgi:hypothetical protein